MARLAALTLSWRVEGWSTAGSGSRKRLQAARSQGGYTTAIILADPTEPEPADSEIWAGPVGVDD
ncbi:hypothetical protein OHB12_10030 [Nocardia sp. NBC_01730]|uniref:hypothetical protein n=1 Tax=Nocardia sp. NBC_01730 TaxID=2975998 RepID=UPI002E14CCB1|nr:hypothetical protein OHB12_10030 [Nocardia sp. NBC_01730]